MDPLPAAGASTPPYIAFLFGSFPWFLKLFELHYSASVARCRRHKYTSIPERNTKAAAFVTNGKEGQELQGIRTTSAGYTSSCTTVLLSIGIHTFPQPCVTLHRTPSSPRSFSPRTAAVLIYSQKAHRRGLDKIVPILRSPRNRVSYFRREKVLAIRLEVDIRT